MVLIVQKKSACNACNAAYRAAAYAVAATCYYSINFDVYVVTNRAAWSIYCAIQANPDTFTLENILTIINKVLKYK